MDAFETLLSTWKNKALVASEAEAAYRKAHAETFVSSTGRTEAARKAEADAATDELRQNRDLSRIEEQAARYRVEQAIRRTAPERAA